MDTPHQHHHLYDTGENDISCCSCSERHLMEHKVQNRSRPSKYTSSIFHSNDHPVPHEARMMDNRMNCYPSLRSHSSHTRCLWISMKLRPSTLIHVTFLAVLAFSSRVSGQCQAPDPVFVMNETLPVGSEIFRLPAAGDVEWIFNIDPAQQEMENYLKLDKDAARELSVMTVAQVIDLDNSTVRVHLADTHIITFGLVCRRPNQQDVTYNTRSLMIETVNEHAPEFNTTNIVITVEENVPSSETLIRLLDWASDQDFNFNTREIARFEMKSAGVNDQIDGLLFLQMASFFGIVTLKTDQTLDFESLPASQKYVVAQVVVTDNGGLSATATLTVRVEDVDDLDPVFYYPDCESPCAPNTYTASVSPNYTGPLTAGIEPAPIQARDGDALGYPIIYSFKNGPAGYDKYISLDNETAEVTVIQELSSYGHSSIVFLVEAAEDSPRRGTNTTLLLIRVTTAAGGIGNPGRSTEDDDDDAILIAAIVLSIFVFICIVLLIIAVIVFRKKWSKKNKVDNGSRPIVRDEAPNAVDSERSTTTSTNQSNSRSGTTRIADEQMRGEEEMIMWMPPKDLVDLSDEDTLKWKKRNGAPPTNTTFTNRDSAFEDSDKKSYSDDSNDQYHETIYAEVDTPPDQRKEYDQEQTQQLPVKKRKAMPLPHEEANAVYKNQTNGVAGSGTLDSGLEDSEYVMPLEARRTQKAPPPGPPIFYNPAFKHEDNDDDGNVNVPGKVPEKKNKKKSKFDKRSGGKGRNDDDNVNAFEGVTSFKAGRVEDKRNKEKEPGVNDEDEPTEYSVPPSNRSSNFGRPLPVPDDVHGNLTTSIDLDRNKYPSPPPRPKVKGQGSGLIIHEDGTTEDPYAKVEKRKVSTDRRLQSTDDKASALRSKTTTVLYNDPTKGQDSYRNDNDSSADNGSPRTGAGASIQPPARRKRPRRRNKPARSPEEDVYDGTKDYEDLEVDSGFYTDTSKVKIKRNNRVPVMRPDPNDTRYWITVTNDY